MVQLKRGDIVLFKGQALISKLIRIFSSTIFEGRAKVNHVGIIVADGDLKDATIVEALAKVYRHNLWDKYADGKTEVAVFRASFLTPEVMDTIVSRAESYVGRSYGYFKIAMHLLDWCIGGLYLFRRLTEDDRYPICSWLVASAYAEASIYFKGKPIAESEPDDIWDELTAHPKQWAVIHDLQRLN